MFRGEDREGPEFCLQCSKGCWMEKPDLLQGHRFLISMTEGFLSVREQERWTGLSWEISLVACVLLEPGQQIS